MSMVVAHVQKFKKADVHGMEVHNERSTERSKNRDIDREKTHLNYDLAEQQRAGNSYVHAVKERVKCAIEGGQKIKKDAVHLCSVLVSSDRAFFDQLQPEEQKKFFQTAKDALENQFGAQNTIAAPVHLDENTPHMHFQFVPIGEDGKLLAKKVVDRTALRKIQDELPKALQRAGFKIERGVSREEKIKHQDTYEWKAAELAKKEQELNLQLTKAQEARKQAETILAEVKQRQVAIDQLLEIKERSKVKRTMLGFGDSVVELSLNDYNKLASAAQAGVEAIHQNEPLKKQVEEMKSAVEKSDEYRRKVNSLEMTIERHERAFTEIGHHVNTMTDALYKTCAERAGGNEIEAAALMLRMKVDKRFVVDATMANAPSAQKIERSDEQRKHAQRIVRDAEKTLEHKLSRGSHHL